MLLIFKRFWLWLGENDTQLKTIFTLVAAFYVVWQYRINLRNEQIARAASYFAKNDEAQILQAQIDLYTFQRDDPALTRFLNENRAEKQDQVRKKTYKEKLPQLYKAGGMEKNVYTLLQFYSDLALCVKASACDPSTACSYFFNFVQGFRETYRPMLNDSDPQTQVIGELVEEKCRTDLQKYCQDVPESSFCQASSKRDGILASMIKPFVGNR
jgi:hypothetical protein